MSLRTRLTLAAGAAVFLALVVASVVIYVNVRAKLHDQIDVSLIQTAENVATKTSVASHRGKLPAGTYGKRNNPKFPVGPVLGTSGSGYFQLIPSFDAAMKQAAQTGSTPLVLPVKAKGAKTRPKPGQSAKQLLAPNSFVPLNGRDGAVASGLAPPYFRDVTYRGTPMRLYTMRLGNGLVRTARPLTEANATIARVRWLLIALTLGGSVAAALLGRLSAATILRPVRRLAGAADDVTATRDLTQRIVVDGKDEVASLARNFNAMLAALEESQQVQQQLIADASHELRTPLTAHRANVELLARPDLPLERRPRVLTAAVRGIDELSTLIRDLIDAARNGKSLDTREPVELSALVTAAIERASRRAPELRFETRIEPHDVSGASTRVERAIGNVIDNAVEWSPAAGTIEVTLSDGLLVVRDHGLGIPPMDLPHVFDRFYRSAAARGRPGSGLGLAIVKQTVEDHGGNVTIRNAGGGGAIVSLRFDPAPA